MCVRACVRVCARAFLCLPRMCLARPMGTLGALRAVTQYAQVLGRLGVQAETAHHLEGDSAVVDDLRASNISALIDLKHSLKEAWYRARRAAIDYGFVLITDVNQALLLAESIERKGHAYTSVVAYDEWMALRDERIAAFGAASPR